MFTVYQEGVVEMSEVRFSSPKGHRVTKYFNCDIEVKEKEKDGSINIWLGREYNKVDSYGYILNINGNWICS